MLLLASVVSVMVVNIGCLDHLALLSQVSIKGLEDSIRIHSGCLILLEVYWKSSGRISRRISGW